MDHKEDIRGECRTFYHGRTERVNKHSHGDKTRHRSKGRVSVGLFAIYDKEWEGLDIKEASTRLNISETTARRWIKSGRLQANMIDGPYGPQYDISEEALDRARRMENVPVLIHDNNPIITQDDITKAIQAAIAEGIANEMAKVEEGILQELDSLKNELEDTRKALSATIEERNNDLKETSKAMATEAEQRNEDLMELARSIQEWQRREDERREREGSLPWWKKMFKG